jgi:hypothetical protein
MGWLAEWKGYRTVPLELEVDRRELELDDAPAAELSELQLSVDHFPAFYQALLALRFPMDVAELLELRFLINHAADGYVLRTPSVEDRQFQQALWAAITSFGIHNNLHQERLTKILMMLRDLHTAHLMGSRVEELRLRDALAELRRRRTQEVRHGIYALIATIFAALTWLGSSEPSWMIRLLTLGLAYVTWESFHTLPTLERQPELLTPALNGVLRRRVETVNWKRLIHKLSLMLGYKQIPGVVVFRGEHPVAERPVILH